MLCLFITILLVSTFCDGFVPSVASSSSLLSSRLLTNVALNAETVGRRELLRSAFGNAVAAVAVSLPSPSLAAAAAEESSTVWLTGKAPKVPNQKPQDKSDTKGTRRDPNFLRSVSDCKAQCELSSGYGNAARSKEECLQDCQDICCTTYEQCTFAIVPR